MGFQQLSLTRAGGGISHARSRSAYLQLTDVVIRVRSIGGRLFHIRDRQRESPVPEPNP
jgi:hypothetical protein